MTEDLKAEEIAEELLYSVGRAIAEGETLEVGSLFDLPQVIETLHGKRLVESEADVREVINSVADYYRENDVVEVVRAVVSAEFIAPDLIGSTHVSRLMRSDGTLFRAPYPVYFIMRRRNGTWRVASACFAILDSPEHNAALASESSTLSAIARLNRNGGSEGHRRP